MGPIPNGRLPIAVAPPQPRGLFPTGISEPGAFSVDLLTKTPHGSARGLSHRRGKGCVPNRRRQPRWLAQVRRQSPAMGSVPNRSL